MATGRPGLQELLRWNLRLRALSNPAIYTDMLSSEDDALVVVAVADMTKEKPSARARRRVERRRNGSRRCRTVAGPEQSRHLT